jgi:hypothetical protein
MNKEFTRMQKLAGLITEGLYTSDEKAPMEAVSHGSGSKMKKSDLKKKIKEMMVSEETPGEEAYAEMGSMDEYDTQGLTNAASVVDHYLKAAYDAGSTGVGFDDNLAYDMMDHLKQFSGEMGGMNEASYEASERMDGLAPISAKGSFVSAARMIISALKRDGFEEEDIHDYLLDLITTLPMEEDLFEAKGDEETDTEDVIVAKGEVPAEEAPAEDVTDTAVDINMDGTPDVDTGSAESKKAFTSLVDTYNASKELGDPKLTQMIANALTYYNKNIILKAGQPQA